MFSQNNKLDTLANQNHQFPKPYCWPVDYLASGKVLNSPINKFQKMATGPSVSSMSLDESHILQLLQGSNIDSEDEIEGEDAYLNDIMFSHSADIDLNIDFDDDG